MIPFKNEPFVDFSVAENAQAMQDAWHKVNKELGRHYPLIIGGEKIETEQKITSINPSEKSQIVGTTGKASQALAEEAMQAALAAFETWKKETPEVRARLLFKAAALLRRRKFEFSAWLSYEAGKTRAEADADTAEAIDFMEYYGRQALELAERGKKTLISLTGEDNRLDYIPLGVGIVIPPWNFPLAIMAGMTTAAIVSGNTVVLKPASTTPVIAAKFVELLEDAGLPAGVVNFLPGSGAEVGDYLVDHPKTRFISFTGSRDIGLRIFERSSRTNKGQIWMKRLVAEMGGKDSIIVHKDADLELAALNIVNSAFGFSGQKCSACSRAIIHQDVYDEVVNRVVKLTSKLTVGNVTDPGNYTGPVIDENAYNKILEYIEIGKQEGKLAAGGEKAPGNGYFIQPTVFVDVAPDARIMQEEIFGPVVGITKASDFGHALEIANNTEYGLTGSVFAKDRAVIEKAREQFHVGNLYFNRKCTGALVGVHPFGGFNMSGTDSKAGGPDYLMLFTQQKLSSEVL